MKVITGRIIRILDKRTVIINLGSVDGVTHNSLFSIMGDPEPVIDPKTNEELGRVKIVKIKIKAIQVSEKFTIAKSNWTKTTSNLTIFGNVFGIEKEDIDEGEFNVKESDIQPWKAVSEMPIQVGDSVEVSIREPEEPEEPEEKPSETIDEQE